MTTDKQLPTLSTLESAIIHNMPLIMERSYHTGTSLRAALGRKSTGLLGSSAKIELEDRSKVHTKVMYLAPSNMSGVNLCPSAQTCISECLNSAGRGAFTNVQWARLCKAQQFIQDPVTFCALIIKEARAHIAKCKKSGVIPAIRLNGVSDVSWGPIWQAIQDMGGKAYEYTKRLDIVAQHGPRVHITYSYQNLKSETLQHLINIVDFANVNIAVVSTDGMPDNMRLFGFDCVNGDTNDNRFVDPVGHIVVLKAKGKAKGKHRSRFTIATKTHKLPEQVIV